MNESVFNLLAGRLRQKMMNLNSRRGSISISYPKYGKQWARNQFVKIGRVQLELVEISATNEATHWKEGRKICADDMGFF